MTRRSLPSHKVTVSLAGSPSGGEVVRHAGREAGRLHPGRDLLVHEAETAVAGRLAQLLHPMRREIDDQQPPRWGQEPGRLLHRAPRIVEIMQHLVDHHEVEALARQIEGVDVALAQIDIGEALHVGARHREHGVAGVDAGGALGARRDELEDLSGTGAEIEHGAQRLVAEHVEDGGLDRRLAGMQRAQPVPLRRELGEEALRGGRALRPHEGEALAVGADDAVVAVERRDDAARDIGLRRRLREAVERPGALAMAGDHAALDHHLEMARDARLRLAEDFGEVGDGQFAARQERQDAQARLLAGRAQHREHGIERIGGWRLEQRLGFRHKDMLISFYEAPQ